MAAISNPAPGSKNFQGEEIGPCINEGCGHTDCSESRAESLIPCRKCGEPIGYDRLFYIEGERPTHKYIHASCLLGEINA